MEGEGTEAKREALDSITLITVGAAETEDINVKRTVGSGFNRDLPPQ